MKKQLLKSVLYSTLVAIIFASCTVTQPAVPTVQVSKFTSIENLLQVKLKCSYEDLVFALGSKPYNVLSSQVDGYTVYVYRYKVLERKVDPGLINQKGGETTGSEVYNANVRLIYFFFKNSILEGFITDEGLKDGPNVLMLNNYLLAIDKNDIIPTTLIQVDTNIEETPGNAAGNPEENKGGVKSMFKFK